MSAPFATFSDAIRWLWQVDSKFAQPGTKRKLSEAEAAAQGFPFEHVVLAGDDAGSPLTVTDPQTNPLLDSLRGWLRDYEVNWHGFVLWITRHGYQHGTTSADDRLREEASRRIDELERVPGIVDSLMRRLFSEVPSLRAHLPATAPDGEPQTPIMTGGQRRLWEQLAGRAMQGPDLANALDTSVETVRQWVSDLRRADWKIEHRPGRGYWRPDAPPA